MYQLKKQQCTRMYIAAFLIVHSLYTLFYSFFCIFYYFCIRFFNNKKYWDNAKLQEFE